jgi:hypothetical protein
MHAGRGGYRIMVRHRFREGIKYAARLRRVVERPIENGPQSGLTLLRMEFEVFGVDGSGKVLSSTGAVACRDLVVGPSAAAFKDPSLIVYANALSLRKPDDPGEWLRLNRQERWVEIVFGVVGEPDLRNRFDSIASLDPAGWSMDEYRYEMDKDWVAVAQAARSLRTSESTVRRRIRELEPEWGAHLLRRTTGGHRRIKLSLLRNLWKA